MISARPFLSLLFAAALAACAELSAERPLFSIADQAGPPPIAEGVWIAVSEECPERYVRGRGRVPKDCMPLQVTREPDGAWRLRYRADLAYGLSEEERAQAAQPPHSQIFVLIPAVDRPLDEQSYAPLYIVEFRGEQASDRASYAALAPIGQMPATGMLVLTGISCFAALRDGPIDGVRERYREVTNADNETHTELETCIAADQNAVRVAVRRAVIEDLESMTRARFVLTNRR